MGMTAAIVGVVGSLIGTGTVATVIGTAITGAIVGAAVGGLSAAVMGGDIGKGMLYGAVGGAVLGGISGYIGATTTSVGGVAGGTEAGAVGTMADVPVTIAEGGGQMSQLGGASGLEQVGGVTSAEGLGYTSTAADGGFLSGISDDVKVQVGTQAVSGVAKGLLAPDAGDVQDNSLSLIEAQQLGRIEEIKQEGIEQRAGLREQYNIKEEVKSRQADTLSRLQVGV